MKERKMFIEADVEVISMTAESVIVTSTGSTKYGDDGDGDLIADEWGKS